MEYEFQNSIGMLTSSISRNIGRIFEQNSNKKGIKSNSIEWTVLSFLANHDYYTQNELCHITGRNKVFIKRLVDDMETKKLVLRQTLGNDKRHNKVIITKMGLERYYTLLTIVEETLDEVFFDFNEIEINTLIRLLKNVAKNIN